MFSCSVLNSNDNHIHILQKNKSIFKCQTIHSHLGSIIIDLIPTIYMY